MRCGQRRQLPMLITRRAEQRVHHEVGGNALTIDFHGDRINQEGHIVVDEFNDRGGCRPAVFFGAGRENPHFCCAGLKFVAKLQMVQGDRTPCERIARDEIVDINVAVVARAEWLDDVACLAAGFAADQVVNLVGEGGFFVSFVRGRGNACGAGNGGWRGFWHACLHVLGHL